MKLVVILFLCVELSCVTFEHAIAQDDLPAFFTSSHPDASEFASAINHFVELGEAQAVRNLKAIRAKQTFSSKTDVHFRLACLCRVLWQNSDHPIAPPRMGIYGGGVSMGEGQSSTQQDWPIFPVAKAGNSYFIVVHGGRSGSGTSHRLPIGYFSKCQSSGSFLTEEVAIPNEQEAAKDSKQLRQSSRWLKQFPKDGDDRNTWKSIESQIPGNDG